MASGSAAVHLLAAGAMAGMIGAMITRTARGHTGALRATWRAARRSGRSAGPPEAKRPLSQPAYICAPPPDDRPGPAGRAPVPPCEGWRRAAPLPRHRASIPP
ncbi:MAG: NnrS family protein [Burkholderiaceae bacterium]